MSLDVTALFTNIPKELVLEAVRKRWHYISQRTEFNLPQFLHAIELILQSTSLCFVGQFYEQIYGNPMGSPLLPILADMVMDDLETQCLSLLDFEVWIFLRYVFMIVPKSTINAVLAVFNNYHPRLQFTFETEANSSIPLLDTLVIRDGDKLITNWYRKPTFSGRYINYFSNHPRKYKINTIINLVDHAILLSDDRFHHTNINIVKDILTNNCFPIKLVNKHIKNRLRQLKNRTDTNGYSGRNNSFYACNCIAIPFIKGLSEGIRRTLEKVGFEVLYKIPKKLSAVIKRGKNSKETNVVYQIDCENCKASYILQTKRHLETRIKEHCNDIKKHDSNFSVVSKHRIHNDHNFKWSDPKILHKECNMKMREIAEMFFTKKYNNNTINLKKDTENLNSVITSV
ncbi:uncharacterized protein LOC143908746 [Temnothorax americanus]|uniref:uncharacterized protein LOC143908746 n=1 Tax=Temnothorax americanus TaxID=1964332 RepID=UPI004068F943